MQLSAPAAATYSASQQPFTLPVELTNSTGGSISSEGMYFLSFHLLSPDGEMLRHDNTRSKLAELKDGETTTVQMIVDPVPAPGTYLLEVDVVHELVTWMGWNGTERPRVRFTVP